MSFRLIFLCRTCGGVHKHKDGLTVTAPVIMWISAIDLLIDRLQKCPDVDLAQIAAISGAAQVKFLFH